MQRERNSDSEESELAAIVYAISFASQIGGRYIILKEDLADVIDNFLSEEDNS